MNSDDRIGHLLRRAQRAQGCAVRHTPKPAAVPWGRTEHRSVRDSEELVSDLPGTVWVGGCSTYFHNASGEVVTQLSGKAGWYREATSAIRRDDFDFGSVTCTTS